MTLPKFSFSTTADEAATALASEIRGKNVLITGTTINGIGFEAARVIAKYAGLVIITGYNSERLKLSAEAIKREIPSANVRTLVLDLSSFAAVRKAAAEVNTYAEPLHVLINNAAATDGGFSLTVDGLELQMAAGHFGPFLFTKLLAPKLLSSGSPTLTPRVVFVSSLAHKAAGPGIDFAHLRQPAPEVQDQYFLRYHEVKAANILTASELSRRAKGKILAYSLHPGSIVTNAMSKDAMVRALQQVGLLKEDGEPNTDMMEWKNLGQGASTTVVAAFDPRINDTPGAYLVDGNVALDEVAPHAADPANAEKLWTMTEEIVGEKFGF